MAVPLQGADELPLVVGGNPSEYGVFPAQGRVVLLSLQLGKVDLLFRAGNARPLGHTGNGQRAVAGDHLDLHALPAEILDGLANLRPQPVAQAEQRQQLSLGGQLNVIGLNGRRFGALHQGQHPQPLRCQLLRLFQLRAGKQPFRRTEDHASHAFQYRQRPFPLAGKRHGLKAGENRPGRTSLRQRRGGRTIRAHAAQEGRQYILQPFLGHIRRGDRLFQRHFAAGQGAGFVHTDHVYPGQ